MKHIKTTNELFGWGKKDKNPKWKNAPDNDISLEILDHINSSEFKFNRDMFTNSEKYHMYKFNYKNMVVRVRKTRSIQLIVDNETMDCDPNILKEIYNKISDLRDKSENVISDERKQIIRKRLGK